MVKMFDLLFTGATFITFVIAVYLSTTDPLITKSVNWAEDKPQETAISPIFTTSRPSVATLYPSNDRWKYIVIHHSATKQGNATIFDNYHRKEKGMKEGLTYHFVIGNGTNSKDGEIEVSERWKKQIQGQHCWNNQINGTAIGICLVGNFDIFRPSSNQIESLVNLMNDLSKQYRIPKEKVLVHKEVDKKKTACPGKYLPSKTILQRLKQ
jgi:N-acetyl-anhydromuramyl-L-alanine amidase AmpD